MCRIVPGFLLWARSPRPDCRVRESRVGRNDIRRLHHCKTGDVMINRRMILAVAAGLAFSASAASAQDWKAKYPELVFAKVPDENASGTTDRWTPLTEYLSRELGTKVTLRIANDYAAVIEGQRSGNIHIAMFGPSAFARAYIIGAKVEP